MVDTSDEYLVLAGRSESLFKEKGSKFLGYAFPLGNEAEIKDLVEEIKALHPKARHHCYAWRLGYKGENYRANDDGEPSGSAGKPILNALLSTGVTHAMVIVVRYFGGTLLGVPGLIHAYKTAAMEALDQAEKEVKTINVLVNIAYDFEQTNAVMQIIKKWNLTVKGQYFEERCGVQLEVRQQYLSGIREELRDYWTVELTVVEG